MDWLHAITGFPETTCAETQKRLSVVDGRLVSEMSHRRCRVGALALPSLAELRQEAQGVAPGRIHVSIARGDVRAMHRMPENEGALFQVASQFNLLEMVDQHVTPEQGVTRYQNDHAQGPSCAMATGAATIFRNYLVPVRGGSGQSASRQIDTAGDLRAALAERHGGRPPWVMRNGYLLPGRDDIERIRRTLEAMADGPLDWLRAKLRIGLHRDIEVTNGPGRGPLVSHMLCAAAPVAYARHPTDSWAPLGKLILEAAYEATRNAG